MIRTRASFAGAMAMTAAVAAAAASPLLAAAPARAAADPPATSTTSAAAPARAAADPPATPTTSAAAPARAAADGAWRPTTRPVAPVAAERAADPFEQLGRASLGLDFGPAWVRDRGLDAFALDGSMSSFGLSGQYEARRLRPHVALVLGGAWRSQTSSVALATENTARLSLTNLLAQGLVRWDLQSWLGVHAGLGLGGSHAAAVIDSGASSLSDRHWAALGRAGAGASLRTVPGLFPGAASFGLSVTMELGWAQATSLSLHMHQDGAAKDAIATRSVDIGRLDVSGPYLDISLRAHF